MKAQAHRIGPRMRAAAEYVRAHPGCTQQQAARAIGPHGSHAYGVRTLRRAAKAGLIVYRPGRRGYALYPAKTH